MSVSFNLMQIDLEIFFLEKGLKSYFLILSKSEKIMMMFFLLIIFLIETVNPSDYLYGTPGKTF